MNTNPDNPDGGAFKFAVAALGEAARIVGQESFYARLLEAVSPLLDWQCRAVVRYSRSSVPVYLIEEGADPEVIELYLRGYYRVDPYYAAFTKNHVADRDGCMMVLSRDLRRQDVNPYIVVFAPTAKWADEIGILLPCHDGTAIGLFWEVIGRTFEADEIARITDIKPLIAGLHAAHDGRLRERTEIEEQPPPPAESPPQEPVPVEHAIESFLTGGKTELTPREREIVRLSLAGLSNADIAEELGIEIGSVKNHRGRLYKKLGIANERDLFRLFLDHLSGMSGDW